MHRDVRGRELSLKGFASLGGGWAGAADGKESFHLASRSAPLGNLSPSAPVAFCTRRARFWTSRKSKPGLLQFMSLYSF